MTPKILFKKLSLQENIDLIKWMYKDRDGEPNIHNITISYIEELKELEEITDEQIIDSKIEQIVTRIYKEKESTLDEEIQRYNEIWSKYNDEYFNELSRYLNIEWNRQTIEAYIGFIPVFPRYLETYTFALAKDLDEKNIIRVCAHETLHFLWFEKWKELYPECPKEEYDSPYIPWQYSEMVTAPILNSPDISRILNVKEKSYDIFYTIKDGEISIMDKLNSVYRENINIEEKIKKGYNYIKNILKENENGKSNGKPTSIRTRRKTK